MKKIYIILYLVISFNCQSPEKYQRECIIPEKVIGCDKFKNLQECIDAKEINFTLAYYLGLDTGNESSKNKKSPPFKISKIRSSYDLSELKKRMIEDRYISDIGSINNEDIILYIQDEIDGQKVGKTATEFRNFSSNQIMNEEAKKKEEEENSKRKILESMQKEINNYPYIFEISCIIDEDKKIELDQCIKNLKPNLKIYSEKKLLYEFSKNLFNSLVHVQLKLPKDFEFNLTSKEDFKDKNLNFLITMHQRTITEENKSDDNPYSFSIGKTHSKKGRNFIFIP
jgi:hypothetical protein